MFPAPIGRFLTRPVSGRTCLMVGLPLLGVVVYVIGCVARDHDENSPRDYRAGPDHFKTLEGREYLLASRPGKPEEWFEITGSALDKSGFQFGIGKDTIPAIDRPVFVKPEDPRLLTVARKPIEKTDHLQVFGYAAGAEAYAYPIGLLDRHELVNQTVDGRPVTVGW